MSETTRFSPDDIALLLRACKETGVTQFTLDGLKVTFNGYVEPVEQAALERFAAMTAATPDPWLNQEIPAPSFPTED